MRPSSIWQRVTRIGVRAVGEPGATKHIVLTNALLVAMILLCLGLYWPLAFALGDRFLELAIPVAAATLAVPLFLNHRGDYSGAAAWFGTVTALGCVVFVRATGPGLHYLLLVHPVAAFLMFPPKSERLLYPVAALGVACFLGLAMFSGAPDIVRGHDGFAARLITLGILSGVMLLLVGCELLLAQGDAPG